MPDFHKFMMRHGDAWETHSAEVRSVRLYLNLNPKFAPLWLALITGHLNKYQIPFQFKLLRYSAAYSRIDTGVVYFPRQYTEFVSALIIELAKNHKGLRRENLPFTRKIAPGISIADNPPGGESFGLIRSRIIARGMLKAWRRMKKNNSEILKSILESFADDRIDPRKPWLNPLNVDFVLDQQPSSPELAQAIPKDSFLKTVDTIGCKLFREAIWYSNKCTWLDWDLLPGIEGSRYGRATINQSLYSGASGISYFLFLAYKAIKQQRYFLTARAAFDYAICKSQEHNFYPSVYSGDSGIIYTWACCREFLDDRKTTAFIYKLIDKLIDANFQNWQNDIIEGRAGVIDLLLLIAEIEPKYSQSAIDKATKLGFELLSFAENDRDTFSWKTTSISNKKNLLGFAHGASGISSSLYNLYSAIGDRRFLDAALKGFAYEYQHFHYKANNWPDYRDPKLLALDHNKRGKVSYMTAWCNGAPGTLAAFGAHVAFCASNSAAIDWGSF